MGDPKEEELKSESFDAVWDAIKEWDISTEEDIEPNTGTPLYTIAEGNHVCRILDSLRNRGFNV